MSSQTDVCLLKKNFSLRLLNCSHFSSDFSLNVLIKFVLVLKKKECMTHFAFRQLRYKTQVDRRIAPDNSLLGNGGILKKGSNNQIHLILGNYSLP